MDPKDGCAFPNTLVVNAGSFDPFQNKRVETQQVYHCPGLGVRAYISTNIMAGLCANPGGPFQRNEQSGWDIVKCKHSDIASLSVALADALISELYKS